MNDPAATTSARMRATPLPGWPRRLIHVAALAAGWALFAWGWHEVLGRPWDTDTLWWLIGGSLVVLPVLTIAWTLHNLGIHRRKGPRTGLRKVDDAYRRDWNGREIVADWPALSHAHLVVIEVDAERKRYRVAAADPVAAPAAGPRHRTPAGRTDGDHPTETADWSVA